MGRSGSAKMAQLPFTKSTCIKVQITKKKLRSSGDVGVFMFFLLKMRCEKNTCTIVGWGELPQKKVRTA